MRNVIYMSVSVRNVRKKKEGEREVEKKKGERRRKMSEEWECRGVRPIDRLGQ